MLVHSCSSPSLISTGVVRMTGMASLWQASGPSRIRNGRVLSVADTLQRLRDQESARKRAWKAAGNTGRPLPEPPTPIEPWSDKATCADAALLERLVHGRARVAHDRCGHSSPFRDFTHIYTMSEADLVQAVNHAEQIAHQAELEALRAERSA
jgi:hypothetical protein